MICIFVTKSNLLYVFHCSIVDRDEPEFIQKIVKDISGKKLNSTNVSIAKHPVGIDSHLQNINRLLDIDHSEEVRKVGIYGCKGIGKTTIAKAIYNWHYSQFDRCCFLMDVRDRSKDQYQIVKLQKLLLHEILGEDLELGNMDRGSTVIKERLCHIKVLIVIDGVEDTDPNPLDKLAEKLDWFGPGSRIIITTTDKHLLDTQDVQLTYEMSTMDRIEAIQLFSWHAFKRNKPIPDYMKLVNVVVRFTKGIPLALVKMGSDLCSRSMDYWERKLLGNDVIEPKGEKSTTIWIVLSKYVETHYNDETGEMHPNLQELFKGALEFPSDVHPKFDMNILKQCHDVDWKDDDFDLQKIKSEQFDDEASHRDSDRTRYDEIGKQGVKARQGQSENIYAGKTRDFGKGCQSMNAFQAGTENPYHSELSDDDAAKQGGFDNPHYGERGDDDTAWKGGNGNTYDSEPEDNDVALQGGIDDSYDGEPVDDDGAGGRDNLYYGEPGDDDSAGQSGTNDPYCGELEDDDVVEKGGNDSPYYGEPGDDGVAEYGGSQVPYDSEPEDDDAARQGEYDGAYYGEPGDNDFAGQDGTDDTFYGEPENDDAAVQGGNDDQYYGELEDDDVAGQGENDSPYYGGETGDDDVAGQGDNETPYYGDAGDDDVAGQAENDSPYYDEARDDEDSGEGEDNN